MTPEDIYNKYKDRILLIMNSINDSLKEEGYVAGSPMTPFSDEDYRWELFIQTQKLYAKEDCGYGVDIHFNILESEKWDGEENGVNFGIDITDSEGRMIGGLTPYNYSNDVWVSRDYEAAVEERFKILEHADIGELIHLVAKHFKKYESKYL